MESSTFAYLLFANGYRYEIILKIIVMVWRTFFGLNIAYARPLESDKIMVYIVLILMSFIVATIINTAMVNLAKVRNEDKSDFTSDVLNRMLEGVLILSRFTDKEPATNVLYCNEVAKGLFKT